MNGPKILVLDVETAPIEAYVWGLFDQNIGINQIKNDWYFLMWAAKWYGEPASETILMDNRSARNMRDDKKLVKALWKLLDHTDIVVTQNGDRFDLRRFNARAIIHGLLPVSPFKSTDTLKESRKAFGFTSHKLEYMSGAVNKKYKKLKHEKYPGFELWRAIVEKNDQKAWKEMGVYCINDVLATEEFLQRTCGWLKTQNLANYFNDAELRCRCGSKNIYKKGFVYTDVGKFQGYKCRDCGKRPRGNKNLFNTDKKQHQLKESNYRAE